MSQKPDTNLQDNPKVLAVLGIALVILIFLIVIWQYIV